MHRSIPRWLSWLFIHPDGFGWIKSQDRYARRGEPTLAAPLRDRGSTTHVAVAVRVRRVERLRTVAVWLIVASVACLVLIGLFLLNNR
jgi:hypothetical protein